MKTKGMRSIILLLIATLFLSCRSYREKREKNQRPKETTTEKKAELGDINQTGDSIRILNASIDGNIVTFEVAYSGGCETHEFSLIGSPMIAKSLPPIRSVVLLHRANNDVCKKYVVENIKFDIRNFAYTENEGEIFLSIKGLENRLLYKFKP